MIYWEDETGTGDEGLVTSTTNGRTPFQADEYGNATVFGTTDNASATPPIDQRIDEKIQFGVLNGSFARGPARPAELIEDINALPDWTGPTNVSGGAITAQWVTDASSPSGHNLRFNISAGAAGDEVYFEQTIFIGGDRSRLLTHQNSANFYRVTASDNNFSSTFDWTYLDASGAAVGSPVTGGTTLAADATAYLSGGYTGTVPATANRLRLRIGVKRNSAAATATATVDVTEVRSYPGRPYISIPDSSAPQTYAPGQIFQVGGVLEMFANTSDAGWYVNSVLNSVYPFSVGGDVVYWVPEHGSAPATPSAGYQALYAKADSKLYSKSDGGTEYAMSLATTVAATAWTPTLSFATVGSSTWAPSVQDGSYIQIGPMVFVWFRYVGVPTNGSGAGNLVLSGLPIVAKTNANSPPTLNGFMGGWTKANYTAIAVQVTSAAQTGLFAAYGSAQAPANLGVADIPTGGSVTMKFSGFYEAA